MGLKSREEWKEGEQFETMSLDRGSFSKTGVEMEAIVAVNVAAITIYDMCKSLSKSIKILEIKLLSKSGGKSKDFKNDKF